VSPWDDVACVAEVAALRVHAESRQFADIWPDNLQLLEPFPIIDGVLDFVPCVTAGLPARPLARFFPFRWFWLQFLTVGCEILVNCRVIFDSDAAPRKDQKLV